MPTSFCPIGPFITTKDEIPDPQDPETFHRSRLDWDEATVAPPEHDLQDLRGPARYSALN